MLPFNRLLSFGLSISWSVISLIGYYFLNWHLGETIIFINLGFISFFLNYFVLFTGLSFRENFIVELREYPQTSVFGTIYQVITGLVIFLTKQFLITCAFMLLITISLIFIGVCFSMTESEGLFEIDWLGESSSFRWLLLAGIVFILLEFRSFYLTFNSNRTDLRKVFDWDAFKPFHANHRRKMYCYYFGSVVAIMVDAAVGEEFHMGKVSLIWLFVMNAYWAFVDLRFPVEK